MKQILGAFSIVAALIITLVIGTHAIFSAEDDFTGQYFNNRTLNGDPALTRQDPVVDFNWGEGSPDPSIQIDNFSARWTRIVAFEEGTYDFTVTADDGVRLYIDNELVIDKWIDQAPTTYTASKFLTAGDHTIKMEYYERTIGAVAKLSWGLQPPPPPASESFQGQYFNNRTLTGTPALLRNDAQINFNWGSGSPDPVISSDNFSARWVRTLNFEEGTYDFTATADDGVRLYIDNELILDKWKDQAPTTYTVSKTLTAGEHTIKMEYYEKGGGAVVKLSWNLKEPPPPPPPPGESFTGEYFNNRTLTGDPVLIRDDSTVNFEWGSGSPDPSVNSDNFSVRWVRTLSFEEGTYDFTVTADDGVKLYIDNELIIDKWIDQAPTTYSGNKFLAAGDHTIRMEYYEKGGGAVAKLSWGLQAGQGGISTKTVTFKEDGSFAGTTYDAQISEDNPNSNFGTDSSINIDGQNPHVHGLIKFPNIFGDQSGQVPQGAEIASANLKVQCFDSSNNHMNAYLLKEDWDESQVTWNNRQNGNPWQDAGADGSLSRDSSAVAWSCSSPGSKSFDMTQFVKDWANGTPNYGIVITETGNNGVDFYSSDADINNRPELTITYQSDEVTPQPSEESFSLIVLPDTQKYSENYPDIFDSQTNWIKDNINNLDIRYVLHEGDIVENPTSPDQWSKAQTSMNILDGNTPYAVALGNHDFTGDRNSTNFNNYFPLSKFQNEPTFGGVFESGKMDNSYHFFAADGIDFMIVSLEFGPRDSVLSWANQVVANNPSKKVIIVTHDYIYDDNSLHGSDPSHTFGPDDPVYGLSNYNTGVDIWEKFVKKHHNILFAFSGHVHLDDGAGRVIGTGDNGNKVYQMLANYQHYTNGGNGYLRIIEINPVDKTVSVKTYSPYLDSYLQNNAQNFTFTNVTELEEFNPAPVINSAEAVTSTNVLLEFSKNLDQTSAENISNYSINNSVTITGANLQPNLRTVSLTTSQLNEGDYVVTVSGVKDTEGKTISPDSTQGFSFSDTNTLTVKISSGGNDAEQNPNGDMYLNSTDLELVNDEPNGGDQIVGLRFNNINVPQNATINNAYIQFTADETNSRTTTLTIKGEKAINSLTFTNSSNDITNRTTTTEVVSWSNVPSWSTVGESGQNQKTPDLTQIIQEIISQENWVSGNSLSIVIEGSGRRVAESYEGSPSKAPEIVVEWSPAP